jgi:hypothetical protein
VLKRQEISIAKTGIEIESGMFSISYSRFLQHDQGPGQPRLGAIEKQPHAQSVGTLHGHQPHLSADMIDVGEYTHLGFVEFGVPLEPRNPLFNRAAKPGTDLKGIIDGGLNHRGDLQWGVSEVENFICVG